MGQCCSNGVQKTEEIVADIDTLQSTPQMQKEKLQVQQDEPFSLTVKGEEDLQTMVKNNLDMIGQSAFQKAWQEYNQRKR